MRRTWFRGNGGYLYADLLVALMIVSILAAVLFVSAGNLKKSYAQERERSYEAIKEYNEIYPED